MKDDKVQGNTLIIYKNGFRSIGLVVGEESYGTWLFTKPDGTTFSKEYVNGRNFESVSRAVLDDTKSSSDI